MNKYYTELGAALKFYGGFLVGLSGAIFRFDWRIALLVVLLTVVLLIWAEDHSRRF